MQRACTYLLSISLLFIGSCKKDKDNEIISKGFIIAGEKGNISTVVYSPVKQILSTQITVIENNAAKDTIVSYFDNFNFDNDFSFDLTISSTARYPNKGSRAILLSSNNNSFSFCATPLNENDTISGSQSWVRLFNNDYILLSLSDSGLNNWTSPKYLGFRMWSNSGNYIYGWMKIEIDDYNQLKIYAYACSN
ncbi:MAG: hypothetical protein HC830_13370 [Bacteroidetes bacterium]|nr:hypothetical protein [Bacteroidota bacterium]